MAVPVELSAVFLNLAADPADFRAFYTVTSLQPSTEVRSNVRVLANGRMRSVKQAGKPRSYSFKVEQISREDVAWLEEHVGELMCIRDDRGRKFFGVYSSVTFDESTLWNDRADVSISFVEVSYSEAV